MVHKVQHDRDRPVYAILYRDDDTVVILGLYAELQDANEECVHHAKEQGIDLIREYPTWGPAKDCVIPIKPARWDAAGGAVSCWVESHIVIPPRIIAPAALETLKT